MTAAVYNLRNISELLSLSNAVVITTSQTQTTTKSGSPGQLEIVVKELLYSNVAVLQSGEKILVGSPLPLTAAFMKEHGISISSKAPTFAVFDGVDSKNSNETEFILFLDFRTEWHLVSKLSSSIWKNKVKEAIKGIEKK